ncbi:cardiolipin synthetase, partial [Rhizobium sp. KAs_5_22]
MKLFNAAKKSIKIATPYFAITEALKKSLILALKNKIDITVYFPGLPDKKIIHKISLSQLKELQQYGLKVQIYQDVF